MSDTPLTDAAIITVRMPGIGEWDYVEPEFARRLEIECQRLREALECIARSAPMPGCECKAVANATLSEKPS